MVRILKRSKAFCPAHITGFFNACTNDTTHDTQKIGSTGAGFSVVLGVTTSVSIIEKTRDDATSLPYTITYTTTAAAAHTTAAAAHTTAAAAHTTAAAAHTTAAAAHTTAAAAHTTAAAAPSPKSHTKDNNTQQMEISKNVIEKFLKLSKRTNVIVNVNHQIAIPIGYGLGGSSAIALSLAYALDDALETHMTSTQIGGIAHTSEIECQTGLGDVLAAYHGGFEIRTKPGAPGVGRVQTIKTPNLSIIIICLAPISTRQFLTQHLSKINGVGEKMTNDLCVSKNYMDFQTMSLEFAKYVGVITERMQNIINHLENAHIKCGVALFGETIFCMIKSGSTAEKRAQQILDNYDAKVIIKTKIDEKGARLTR